MTEHVAIGGSLLSIASTVAGLKWLHARSVAQGEKQAADEARLDAHDKQFDAHDQKFSEVLSRLDETNTNLRMVMDHLMNGKK